MKSTDPSLANQTPVRLPHALVLLGHGNDREALLGILWECGLQPMPCSSLKRATALLASHVNRVAFCEDRLCDGDYTDFLTAVRSSEWPIPVVVCSQQPNLGLYLDVMEMGAYDLMVPPYRKTDVRWILEGAQWIERMRSEHPPARGRIGGRPYAH